MTKSLCLFLPLPRQKCTLRQQSSTGSHIETEHSSRESGHDTESRGRVSGPSVLHWNGSLAAVLLRGESTAVAHRFSLCAFWTLPVDIQTLPVGWPDEAIATEIESSSAGLRFRIISCSDPILNGFAPARRRIKKGAARSRLSPPEELVSQCLVEGMGRRLQLLA